jgi:class 3 adenylate cyclase/tetratricopeptide (TPR) repeat protein
VGVTVDRDHLVRAIAAQEQLRGTVPDEIVDAAVAALRAQLDVSAEVQSVRPEPVARRRLASVLFADVAGFTAMSEQLDAEVVASLMNDLWEQVDGAVRRHGGRVDKHIGDAVMGVWGVDAAREDDAERAVRAALDVHEAFAAFRASRGFEVDARIGVNTGPVVFGRVGTSGELSVTGDAVNLASRIEHVAPEGGVLISHDTYRHVRGLFDVQPMKSITVKGKSAPLRTYLVKRAKPRAFRMASRGVEGVDIRMVGRGAEVAELEGEYLDMLATGRSRIVTVIGEAGAGKSRLLDEFANWLELRPESVYYLKGRSVPDLQAVPRSLMREVFADRFEIYIDDEPGAVAAKLRSGLQPLTWREADVAGHWLGFDLVDSEAVRDLAGSSEFSSTAQAHLVRHLTWLLDRSPVVMLLEDVHWADSDSLDTMTHLVDTLDESPTMVVCATRPDLLGRRPEWGSGPGRSISVTLQPLAEEDGRALVAEILQLVSEVPEQLVDLIVERASGNPFHAEELVKMLIDDAVIVVEDDASWRVDLERLDRVSVPSTLAGVMQARLDGLDADERIALQHASVIGRTFWDDAVATLLSFTGSTKIERARVTPTLQTVRGRDLVTRHDRSVFIGCDEYSFRHALIRDATYETVLLRDRERLHGRAASWLEGRAGKRLSEHAGLIAEHLSRAGELDRAAELFDRAAANATSTGALDAAARAYERSLYLRESRGNGHGPEATKTRIELGHAYFVLGRYDDASVAFATAEADGRSLADEPLVAQALIGDLYWSAVRGAWARANGLLERARPLAEAHGGRTLGLFLSAEAILLRDGPGADLGRGLDVSVRALGMWRSLDDASGELRAINNMGVYCHLAGRLGEAERWFSDGLALARRIGDTTNEVRFLDNEAVQAHLRARRDGDYDIVLERYRTCRDRRRTIGLSYGSSLANLAQAETEAGQIAEATRSVHEALRIAWRQRAPADWAFALIVLAQLAIAEGSQHQGLALLGAVLAAEGTPPLHDEVDGILAMYEVSPAAADEGMAAGLSVDLEQLVETLVAGGPEPQLSTLKQNTRPPEPE